MTGVNAARAVGLMLIGLVSDQLHDLRLALLVLAPSALILAAVFATLGLTTMPRDVADAIIGAFPFRRS